MTSSGAILLTSAGRRVSLLRLWQAAAAARDFSVLVNDVDALAPAVLLADESLPSCRVTQAEYVPQLLHLVQQRRIQLIVPTIDTELPLLASAADQLKAAGATPLISSQLFITICNDKWEFGQAFAARGVVVAEAWLPEQLADAEQAAELPEALFIKPRDGSASLHAYAFERADWQSMLPRVPNAIIQERLSGQEITIDALLDFSGCPLHYVPRQRIRTVGGESIQGLTIDDAEIKDWLVNVLEVAGKLGAYGPITAQAFLTPKGPVLTEINPRFGGGYPLGYAAGGHYPEWILALLAGETVPQRLGQYSRGLYMTRHYQETFITQKAW